MIFNEHSHARLAELFNAPGYAGYKPDVSEAPNSDGIIDTAKRYLHVALKYDPPEWARWYLARAHYEACRVAEALGVPDAFYPRVENGTLRVLEYPIGAGTAEHTDFALFSILCWRSTPDDLELNSSENGECDPPTQAMRSALDLAPKLHIGRIGEMVGLGPATLHRVPGRPYAQKAIVYFAMPANAARFPESVGPIWAGRAVSEWLAEIYSKSRVYR